MNLAAIGANDWIYRAFEPYATQSLTLARVAWASRDQYRLLTATGEVDAEPSGVLCHRSPTRAAMPVVGDWIAARAINDEQAIVEAVLPRRTLFSRRAAGKREDEQPTAANIDVVFLVCGLDGDFNLRRLERYLALTAASGAAPVILLNKADLRDDLDSVLRETRIIAGDTPVEAISAIREGGIAAVSPYLAFGRTVALLGSSGAGKSSILNALLGEERLRTGAVREHDSRGRHTTTYRELIVLPEGGALIDTPGMREVQLWATEQSVDSVFEEVATLAAGCRYRNCSHTVEAGCAVLDGVADGTVDASRVESYRKLAAEARWHQQMADPLAALARKRKWKTIHKAARKFKQR